jgi:hypothetical protein
MRKLDLYAWLLATPQTELAAALTREADASGNAPEFRQLVTAVLLDCDFGPGRLADIRAWLLIPA